MRALLLILAATSALGQGRFDRTNSRCSAGRSSRGFACDTFVALADAPQASDLAGNWWAMRGDGTMRSGSAVTLVPTGAPTNSVENGWPVRTYTAAQNDQEPSNVAFPASDFSVCYHRRNVALPNTQIMAFGTSGVPATYTALPWELQTNGNLISNITDGVGSTAFTGSAAPLPIVAGNWYVLCFTYQRVGGAANNVATMYVNGVAVNSSAVMALANTALSSVWSTNGYAAASAAGAGSTRGVFVTYKLLSPADIARISAATAP